MVNTRLIRVSHITSKVVGHNRPMEECYRPHMTPPFHIRFDNHRKAYVHPEETLTSPSVIYETSDS